MDISRSYRILYLEDDNDDITLVKEFLENQGIRCDLSTVQTSEEYLEAMKAGGYDLILSDSGVPGFSGRTALGIAREKCPGIPFVFFSGHFDGEDGKNALEREGAAACIRSATSGKREKMSYLSATTEPVSICNSPTAFLASFSGYTETMNSRESASD